MRCPIEEADFWIEDARFLGRTKPTKRRFATKAGRARPIGKLLLSYHALGNILIALSSFDIEQLPDEGYCKNRLATLSSQITQVEEALSRSCALTELGRSLWKPISRRLADGNIFDKLSVPG